DLDAARAQHLAPDLAQHHQLVGPHRRLHHALRPDDEQIGRAHLALQLALDASRADERQPTARLGIRAQGYAYVFPHRPPPHTTPPRLARGGSIGTRRGAVNPPLVPSPAGVRAARAAADPGAISVNLTHRGLESSGILFPRAQQPGAARLGLS